MSTVPGIDLVTDKAMDPGHRKKKKKGGKKKKEATPPPAEDSGHDAASESSLHDHNGLDHSSQPENGYHDKFTGECYHTAFNRAV